MTSEAARLAPLTAEACPKRGWHTPCPGGQGLWHRWAERKFRTHYQVKCPCCGFYAIWKRRETPLTKAQVEADLYPPSHPRNHKRRATWA